MLSLDYAVRTMKRNIGLVFLFQNMKPSHLRNYDWSGYTFGLGSDTIPTFVS
jgi:hypothetical protein